MNKGRAYVSLVCLVHLLLQLHQRLLFKLFPAANFRKVSLLFKSFPSYLLRLHAFCLLLRRLSLVLGVCRASFHLLGLFLLVIHFFRLLIRAVCLDLFLLIDLFLIICASPFRLKLVAARFLALFLAHHHLLGQFSIYFIGLFGPQALETVSFISCFDFQSVNFSSLTRCFFLPMDFVDSSLSFITRKLVQFFL